MTATPMMRCGHAANAHDAQGHPTCAICVGLHPGATVVDPQPPDLSGRIARCDYCKRERPSSPELAFFTHRPAQPHDSFYCGCRGWD